MSSEAFENPVSSLVSSEDILVCAPEATLESVLDLMRKRRVGCVIVTVGRKVEGIFTERDYLMKPLPQGSDLSKIPVSQLMVPKPSCLSETQPIRAAILMMRVGKFRHIPIVDKEGLLKGIISVRDVVYFVADSFELRI